MGLWSKSDTKKKKKKDCEVVNRAKKTSKGCRGTRILLKSESHYRPKSGGARKGNSATWARWEKEGDTQSGEQGGSGSTSAPLLPPSDPHSWPCTEVGWEGGEDWGTRQEEINLLNKNITNVVEPEAVVKFDFTFSAFCCCSVQFHDPRLEIRWCRFQTPTT